MSIKTKLPTLLVVAAVLFALYWVVEIIITYIQQNNFIEEYTPRLVQLAEQTGDPKKAEQAKKLHKALEQGSNSKSSWVTRRRDHPYLN